MWLSNQWNLNLKSSKIFVSSLTPEILAPDEGITKTLNVLIWLVPPVPLPRASESIVCRLRSLWTLWMHHCQLHVYAHCKQFIQRDGPRREAACPAEFTFRSLLYSANRCNQLRCAAVIPMTLCSLLYHHRSPLHTPHIKCSNTQREIPWHKYALTHTFALHSPLTHSSHSHTQTIWTCEDLF